MVVAKLPSGSTTSDSGSTPSTASADSPGPAVKNVNRAGVTAIAAPNVMSIQARRARTVSSLAATHCPLCPSNASPDKLPNRGPPDTANPPAG